MTKRDDGGAAKKLLDIAEDRDLLEVARHAIEVALLEARDARISQFTRNNGLVVREASGEESSVIRFGPEDGMRIGLRAIASHIAARNQPGRGERGE